MHPEKKKERKPKVLIAFDDMIADIIGNKKPSPIVTERFIRDRKLNIFLLLLLHNLISKYQNMLD